MNSSSTATPLNHMDVNLRALIGLGLVILSAWLALGSVGILPAAPVALDPIGGFILGLALYLIGYGFFHRALTEANVLRLDCPYSETDRVLLPEENLAFVAACVHAVFVFGIIIGWFSKLVLTESAGEGMERYVWGVLIFYFWALPVVLAGVAAVWIALGIFKFGKIPFVLISTPIRIGAMLEGFLQFPSLRVPRRITATLLFCEGEEELEVAKRTCRLYSSGEMLRLINKKAPGQVEQILPLLDGPFARVPISMRVPSRKPPAIDPGEVPTGGGPFSCGTENICTWKLRVTASVFGVDLSRVYPLPIQNVLEASI